MEAQIRRMVREDEREVLAMMRLFYDSPAVLHTASDEVLRRDFLDCVGEMPLLRGYVFEQGGEIAGYAMAAMSYTTEYGGLCVWLEDLYIKPPYRGMGFPRKLFHLLEEEFPEAVRFKLEVEAENERAIAAYEKNGYRRSPYLEMTKEMEQ